MTYCAKSCLILSNDKSRSLLHTEKSSFPRPLSLLTRLSYGFFFPIDLSSIEPFLAAHIQNLPFLTYLVLK